MQVITMLNEKGGVGKTTLSRELALGLSQMGLKVLCLDADGQGDLTRSLGIQMNPKFNDFCRRPDVDLRTLVERVPQDVTPHYLYVVAGNHETWGIAGSSRTGDLVRIMSARMKQLSKMFDYCIIDTQPSPTQLHDAISLVSRWVIFPTDPEKFSAEGGLYSSIRNIEHNRESALQRGFNVSEPLAIVPNKFRVKTVLHQVFYERLQSEYGELVWEPIPLRTAIPESQVARDSLTLTAPNLRTSQDLYQFAERVFNATRQAV